MTDDLSLDPVPDALSDALPDSLPDSLPSIDSERLARRLLRFGSLAKGFVFVVIGVLSLELARRGLSSQDADQQGALKALAGAPVGRIAVFAVSAGLLLYSAWQVWAAIVQDSDDHDGSDRLIHTFSRVGWLGLAGVYALLGWTGLKIALDGASAAEESSGGPTSPSGITGRLLDVPAGRVLVVVIGLVTVGVGVYQLRKGVRQDFLDDIDTSDLGERHRQALAVLGTAGFAARALLMGTAGGLFVDAAFENDADRAAGLDQSLQTLTGLMGGQLLLTACGVGLLAAGAYDMVTFRRQRIDEV